MRRRVRLDTIDREHLRDAILEAITAAEGDLHLAAAVLRMPVAALEEIVADDPTLHRARRKV